MRQPNSQTRIWLDAQLAKHHINPQIRTVFDNINSIKHTIARGQCLTILPAYAVQTELEQGLLQALSIENQPLQRMLKLVRKEEKPVAPPANAFLVHVESCLRSKYGTEIE